MNPSGYREAHFAKEEKWQDAVVEWARGTGWMVHFVPDKLYRRSFKTKAQREAGEQGYGIDLGDRGYPDLTLVGHGRVLYRELKVGRNTLTEAQERWRDRLIASGQDWGLWHPRDADAVWEELSGERV